MDKITDLLEKIENSIDSINELVEYKPKSKQSLSSTYYFFNKEIFNFIRSSVKKIIKDLNVDSTKKICVYDLFSGGGMSALMFSYAILTELKDTQKEIHFELILNDRLYENLELIELNGHRKKMEEILTILNNLKFVKIKSEELCLKHKEETQKLIELYNKDISLEYTIENKKDLYENILELSNFKNLIEGSEDFNIVLANPTVKSISGKSSNNDKLVYAKENDFFNSFFFKYFNENILNDKVNIFIYITSSNEYIKYENNKKISLKQKRIFINDYKSLKISNKDKELFELWFDYRDDYEEQLLRDFNWKEEGFNNILFFIKGEEQSRIFSFVFNKIYEASEIQSKKRKILSFKDKIKRITSKDVEKKVDSIFNEIRKIRDKDENK